MNWDSQAAIIANDLDSLVHRIEALPAHPEYTNALMAVQAAKKAISDGRTALHQESTMARNEVILNRLRAIRRD